MPNLDPQLIIQVNRFSKAAKSQNKLLIYLLGFNCGLFGGLISSHNPNTPLTIIISLIACISLLKIRGIYINHKYRVIIEILKTKQQ